MKASDFTAAQTQTRAVQKILEDDHDLGVVFRQWCVRALERFIQQSASGDTPSTSAGEERVSPFFGDRKQVASPGSNGTGPASKDSPAPAEEAPASPAQALPQETKDLVARIRTLMGTVEQVERLAELEKN